MMANERPDLAAMEAFAKSLPLLNEHEMVAAARWIWVRAQWEIEHRKRWPWWRLER